MTRKRTHEEYERELFDNEIDCIPIDRYIDARTPILHQCINEHVYKAYPHNILAHKRNMCRLCDDVRLKSHDTYIQELKDKNISYIPLEKYKGGHKHILHKCSCGHEWRVTPVKILAGKGCPSCAPKGIYSEKFFEKNPEVAKQPGILYCIVLVNRKTSERVCLKIGITKGTSFRDVHNRASGFTGYEARIQKLVHGPLEEVYHLEQWLHETWSHKKYKSPWRFGGHTELFELDNEIVKSIPTTV